MTVYGVVTPAVLNQLVIDVRAHTGPPIQAFCLRLDRAVLALSGDLLRAVEPGSLLQCSVAIVVQPEMQAVFQGYAWQMAELGLVRVVFTSPGPALMWAASQARVAQAELVWQSARAQRPASVSA